MLEQALLELALGHRWADSEKIEAVRVFDYFLGEFGPRRRQCSSEIGQGLSLSSMKAAFNLMHEDIGSARVPLPGGHTRVAFQDFSPPR